MTYEFTRKAIRGIVRETATVDVAEIGNVEFDRPCLYHMGRTAWHVDFAFSHGGRDYHGTYWQRDSEIELSIILEPSRYSRLLPETAKQAWRDAIKAVARAITREAAQMRTAFIDSGDFDNAERVAMGLAVKVEPEASEPEETVAREVAENMGFGTETVTESPVTLAITSAPMGDESPLDPAETIRAAIGSLAYACGALDAPSFSTMRANLADLQRLLPLLDSPMATSEPILHHVTGRCVDGTVYLSPFGWQDDRLGAYVFTESDARIIAAREERKQAETRNPDCGIYQIKATAYRGPVVTSLAEYESAERESEQLNRMAELLDSPMVQAAIANENAMREYVEQVDGELDTSHKPLNGYRYRGYQGQE